MDLEELEDQEEGECDSAQGQEQHYLEMMQIYLHNTFFIREKTCRSLSVEDGKWDNVAMVKGLQQGMPKQCRSQMSQRRFAINIHIPHSSF